MRMPRREQLAKFVRIALLQRRVGPRVAVARRHSHASWDRCRDTPSPPRSRRFRRHIRTACIHANRIVPRNRRTELDPRADYARKQRLADPCRQTGPAPERRTDIWGNYRTSDARARRATGGTPYCSCGKYRNIAGTAQSAGQSRFRPMAAIARNTQCWGLCSGRRSPRDRLRIRAICCIGD